MELPGLHGTVHVRGMRQAKSNQWNIKQRRNSKWQ